MCELKRLASAVQLRPWPPYFKALNGSSLALPVRSQSALAEAVESDYCTAMIANYLAGDVRFLSPLSVRFGRRRY
jgi:hypothetical protein